MDPKEPIVENGPGTETTNEENSNLADKATSNDSANESNTESNEENSGSALSSNPSEEAKVSENVNTTHSAGTDAEDNG